MAFKVWSTQEKLLSVDLNANFTLAADLSSTQTFTGAKTFTANAVFGVNGTGVDVQMFGDTASAHLLWDQSADSLLLVGGAKINAQGTVTVGVNDTGYDVQLFGATAGAHLLWDENVNTLKLVGGAKINAQGTVTVGVNDTGYDVQFFGAAAGAHMIWDESVNLLELRGATAAGPGHLKLTTGELTVADGDILGRIDFQAPLETGADALLVAASIWAESDVAFDATNNATSLVFAAATSETAAGVMRMSKTALHPAADDGMALGVTNTFEWSDAHFANGATITFHNSDIVLTHSSNTLTLTGGTGVGFAPATTDCKFAVYHNAGTANVTGDGTAFTMTYGAEVFDTGSDFASNTFTAPAAGQYLFTCMVSLVGVLAAHTDGRIEIVTTQNDQMMIFSPGKTFESNTIVRPHISAIMDMDAGDTAYIRLTVYNAARVVDLQNTYLSNQFSGAIQ
tara:strand:+ start:1306 stop:2664 length:1359 start_codon:yes stop_codon:yes gene_type:complete